MFEDLLRKQICCYKDGSLSESALDCLRFMYPHFKVVKTEFDIYPGEPFIYIGDIKWVHKIQKHTEPFIIVASTGEYDLTDRETLIKLAYKKFNKTPPKYITESNLLKDCDIKQFMYNWKYIWITGQPVDKLQEKDNLFFDILNKLTSPVEVMKTYVKALIDFGNDEGTSFLESSLITFIKKSRNINSQNTKTDKMLKIRTSFINSFDKNVHKATMNLLESPIDNKSIKFMDFLLDMIWARR